MKRRILAVCTISLLLTLPLPLQSQKPADDTQRKKPVVTLTVDYGDGAQKRYPEIPWRKEMTVHDALSWAEKHPHGIELDSRGRGKTTLITKIDDLKNSGSSGKNWVYRVNDQLGDKSCADFPVKPRDRILWKFERYQ